MRTFLVVAVAVLAVLFWPAFQPGHCLFSNDNPLGMMKHFYSANLSYASPIEAFALMLGLLFVGMLMLYLHTTPPASPPPEVKEDGNELKRGLLGVALSFGLVYLGWYSIGTVVIHLLK